MPPALRNQRAPTAGDTPAPTAASSVEHPAAIAAQNSWRSSRRATEGRPGNGKAPRPDRSERCFRMAIATSSLKVLRRPLEPKQRIGIKVCPERNRHGEPPSFATLNQTRPKPTRPKRVTPQRLGINHIV